MQTSGKPNEGLMILIPLTIFVLFVVVALGGPVAFMNTVSYWVTDFVSSVVNWLRNL